MIWALLSRNPLISALVAGIVTIGVYATVLKIETVVLKKRTEQLEQAEESRKAAVKAAEQYNKAKEESDRKRTKQLEVDNARSKKAIDSLHSDNLRLLADIDRLRDSSACAVPQTSALPPANNGASAPQLFGTCERVLAGLAREADQVRENLLTCQAYVRGL